MGTTLASFCYPGKSQWFKIPIHTFFGNEGISSHSTLEFFSEDMNRSTSEQDIMIMRYYYEYFNIGLPLHLMSLAKRGPMDTD